MDDDSALSDFIIKKSGLDESVVEVYHEDAFKQFSS